MVRHLLQSIFRIFLHQSKPVLHHGNGILVMEQQAMIVIHNIPI